MKNFNCQICGKSYPTLSHLSKHINNHQISKKEYYDLYLKKEGEGVCSECGGLTQYTNIWQSAYLKYCSIECKKKGVSKNIEKTTIKRYGVTNINKSKKFRDKIKKTNRERYGNSCPMQNNDIKKQIHEKNLQNIGVEMPFQSAEIQKKGAKIRKQKYGAEYTYQSPELSDKCRNTMILKYDAPYTLQSEILFNKSFKNRILLKKFRDDIIYQGTYELDFLEKYYDRLNIQRASFIKYKFKNKQKIYYPDFYIDDKNLIIEIKNKYLAKRDRLKIAAKRKAVIKQGYSFILIVDKKYDEFEKLISDTVL